MASIKSERETLISSVVPEKDVSVFSLTWKQEFFVATTETLVQNSKKVQVKQWSFHYPVWITIFTQTFEMCKFIPFRMRVPGMLNKTNSKNRLQVCLEMDSDRLSPDFKASIDLDVKFTLNSANSNSKDFSVQNFRQTLKRETTATYNLITLDEMPNYLHPSSVTVTSQEDKHQLERQVCSLILEVDMRFLNSKEIMDNYKCPIIKPVCLVPIYDPGLMPAEHAIALNKLAMLFTVYGQSEAWLEKFKEQFGNPYYADILKEEIAFIAKNIKVEFPMPPVASDSKDEKKDKKKKKKRGKKKRAVATPTPTPTPTPNAAAATTTATETKTISSEKKQGAIFIPAGTNTKLAEKVVFGLEPESQDTADKAAARKIWRAYNDRSMPVEEAWKIARQDQPFPDYIERDIPRFIRQGIGPWVTVKDMEMQVPWIHNPVTDALPVVSKPNSVKDKEKITVEADTKQSCACKTEPEKKQEIAKDEAGGLSLAMSKRLEKDLEDCKNIAAKAKQAVEEAQKAVQEEKKKSQEMEKELWDEIHRLEKHCQDLDEKNFYLFERVKDLEREKANLQGERLYGLKTTDELKTLLKTMTNARLLLEAEIHKRLFEELDSLKKEQECPVCFSKRKDCLLECGHAFCMGCATKVETCPTCRKDIKTRTKMYS